MSQSLHHPRVVITSHILKISVTYSSSLHSSTVFSFTVSSINKVFSPEYLNHSQTHLFRLSVKFLSPLYPLLHYNIIIIVVFFFFFFCTTAQCEGDRCFIPGLFPFIPPLTVPCCPVSQFIFWSCLPSFTHYHSSSYSSLALQPNVSSGFQHQSSPMPPIHCHLSLCLYIHSITQDLLPHHTSNLS